MSGDANGAKNSMPKSGTAVLLDSEKASPMFIFLMVIQWVFFAILISGAGIGIAYSMDEASDDEQQHTPVELCWKVYVPVTWICMLLVAAVQYHSRSTAQSAVRERSHGTSMKDASKNAMTNSGIVAALVLSFVMGLIADPPGGDNGNQSTLVSHWYGSLLVVTAGFETMAVVMSCLAMLHMDCLSEEATHDFINKMPYILGRPIMFMIFGLLVFSWAVLLNVQVLYGNLAFAFSCFISLILTITCILEWKWMGDYRNDIDRKATLAEPSSGVALLSF